jgi:hypothetical protein
LPCECAVFISYHPEQGVSLPFPLPAVKPAKKSLSTTSSRFFLMLERRTVSSIRYPTAMKKMQMPELAQSWNQKLLNAGMPVPIISMLGILLTFTIFFMVEKNISSHFCLTSCQELLSPARYHRKKASNI